MKGIILAGGKGTRLNPLTDVLSKQILPVYDKPMIYYPLSVLMLCGIREILIISTGRDMPLFSGLLKDGAHLGLHIEYKVQEEPRGLAEAFIIGEDFIADQRVCLILGDNILYGENLPRILKGAMEHKGASLFGYYVQNPSSYGVVEVDKNNRIVSLEEKPENPRSHYAVPGIYFYDNKVASLAKKVKPSARGELEITDLNRLYLEEGTLSATLFGRGIAWLDAGTIDDLLDAANFIHAIEKRQGLKIACLEEIAFKKEYITLDDLKNLAEGYKNSLYGEYLQTLVKQETRMDERRF